MAFGKSPNCVQSPNFVVCPDGQSFSRVGTCAPIWCTSSVPAASNGRPLQTFLQHLRQLWLLTSSVPWPGCRVVSRSSTTPTGTAARNCFLGHGLVARLGRCLFHVDAILVRVRQVAAQLEHPAMRHHIPEDVVCVSGDELETNG